MYFFYFIALADYAHSKGLLFGIYSDAGYRTCAGRIGSLGNFNFL
jgi:alpha-galactosidase